MMSRITINIKRDMIMGTTTDEEDSFFHPTPPDATNTSLYFRHETTGGFTNSEFEANFNNLRRVLLSGRSSTTRYGPWSSLLSQQD